MNENMKDALKVIEENCCLEPDGNRVIAVLDKGWIFVGYLSEIENGRLKLENVYNLRKWQTGGFGMVCTNPAEATVTLDKSGDLRFRQESVVFTVPISADWGK